MASTRTKQQRRKANKRGKSQVMTLQFREVDELAFVGCEYKPMVYWMKGNSMVNGLSTAVEVELLYEDLQPVKKPATIVGLERKHVLSRPLALPFRFKESSLHHDNKKFRLRVRATGNFAGLVEPAVSKPISVIKYKLHVENELPKQFFKDQGGRERRMELRVQLKDAYDKPVRLPKPMPLVAQLCYEKTHDLVPNQHDILKFKHAEPKIGRDGQATILFRIEEVSSRHQRQNFQMYITPDIERCPLNGDVLAVYSSAVTVRSKETGKTNRKRPRKMQYPRPGVAPQIGKCMEDALAASKRMRLDPGASVKGAIDNLIYWSTHTCDVIRSIQAQHVGYGVNSDGSENFGFKIYRCPSCSVCSCDTKIEHKSDCTLNKVLELYEETVGPGVASILKSLEGPALPDTVQHQHDPHDPLAALPLESVDPNQDPVPPPQLPPPNPALVRFSSRDSLTAMIGSIFSSTHSPLPMDFNSAQSPLVGANSPRLHFMEGEHCVHYVYKKHFHNGQTNLGYPAFDKRSKLNGFFSENSHAVGLEESIEYLGLSELKLHPNKVHQVEKEFAKLSMQTPTSEDLIKCVGDYAGLSQMKQDLVSRGR